MRGRRGYFHDIGRTGPGGSGTGRIHTRMRNISAINPGLSARRSFTERLCTQFLWSDRQGRTPGDQRIPEPIVREKRTCRFRRGSHDPGRDGKDVCDHRDTHRDYRGVLLPERFRGLDLKRYPFPPPCGAQSRIQALPLLLKPGRAAFLSAAFYPSRLYTESCGFHEDRTKT